MRHVWLCKAEINSLYGFLFNILSKHVFPRRPSAIKCLAKWFCWLLQLKLFSWFFIQTVTHLWFLWHPQETWLSVLTFSKCLPSFSCYSICVCENFQRTVGQVKPRVRSQQKALQSLLWALSCIILKNVYFSSISESISVDMTFTVGCSQHDTQTHDTQWGNGFQICIMDQHPFYILLICQSHRGGGTNTNCLQARGMEHPGRKSITWLTNIHTHTVGGNWNTQRKST